MLVHAIVHDKEVKHGPPPATAPPRSRRYEAAAGLLPPLMLRGTKQISYQQLRDELGTLYNDQLFADLYPPEGRPVEVAPWRLALVMVMQYIEGLTDRQAADAVRRCMDWKYS